MTVPIPASFRAEIAGRAPDGAVGPCENSGSAAGGAVSSGRAAGGISGDDWLVRLPRLLDERLDAWDLVVDGEPWHGACALVLPVRRAGDGRRLAFKVTWPHVEARTEHLALRAWGGRGAVRLEAAYPADFALLLERLDGDRDLEHVGILDACEALGDLFRRLDRPATPQFDTLAAQIPRWRGKLSAPVPGVPRRLLQQTLSHLDDLAPGLADGAGARLVHTDLHFMNALAPLAEDPEHDLGRGDWLAIDPKPLAGEWAYAVAPAVWNRAEETARAHSATVHVRMRADIIADVAGLDPDRVRMWTFARLVLNAVDASDHGDAATPFRTRMIALSKAFAAP